MVLSMKNVNILGVHRKIRLLGARSQKSIEGGDCLKGRGLGQFADLRGWGFGKKEGGDVFEQRG